MDEAITYDVRIYKIELRKGKTTASYHVRWKTGHKTWKAAFRNAAQADSFRSSLLAAARNGEAFSLTTGRPTSWQREESSVSWYAFTLDYSAIKWSYVSPNHRRGIAEALTDATEAMLSRDDPPHTREQIRRALQTWAYSERLRSKTDPPDELAAVVHWLETGTIPLADLARPGTGPTRIRAILERLSRKQDGKPAAANTAMRKRIVINNAMEYASEIGALPANPLKSVRWMRPRTLRTVDPRVVINPAQARRFFAAMEAHSKRAKRMKPFFGFMYYAALRPEEASDLRYENLVSLPRQGWGEMILTHSTPRSGSHWTDNGKPRERRALKHRADGDTRRVPIHPELVTMLRDHLDEFGTGPHGRLFTGPRGGIITDRAYLKIFHEARAQALTTQEASSPLLDVPYALRHAAVSTWLNAGVAPPQVAEWAGHSVAVLLRIYAKCIAGQQDEAMRRIYDATQHDPPKRHEDDDQEDSER
jgi:site-specific recombinase XerD